MSEHREDEEISQRQLKGAAGPLSDLEMRSDPVEMYILANRHTLQ